MDSAEISVAPLAARAPRSGWHLPGWLDRVAILLSGLCVVHCIATTVAVVLLASVGGLLLDPRIHETGLAIAMVLGAVALFAGARAHGSLLPLAIGACGLGLMAVGLVVPHGLVESGVTILGVSILATGHWLNRRAHAGHRHGHAG